MDQYQIIAVLLSAINYDKMIHITVDLMVTMIIHIQIVDYIQ